MENRFGRDVAKLKVNVLDVPGKPTGPLSFSDISAEAITLHWGTPKDDGGLFFRGNCDREIRQHLLVIKTNIVKEVLSRFPRSKSQSNSHQLL